ncbi:MULTISPECIES: Imm5 family immunity protein [Pseudomonas syringae group]|uniref:Imm5 family immunity protein n=1 Tax=Pseudomonas syringae group TaxID=136849 RepID=UPI00217F530A|nr:Imm5 family immunity protein [Pseudomonas syringae group genomosp. 7]
MKKLLLEIAKSPEGEVILPLRKLLWNAITEYETAAKKKIILTALEVMCVRQGVNFWIKKFGDNEPLNYILNIALEAAEGQFDEAKALGLRDEFYVSIVEDQEYEAEEYPAMFVGHAAANTIATAVDDFKFDPYDHRMDRDLNPESFETSYLVASAFAGGLSEDGDPKLRRAFWEWYLSIAVPQVL